MTAAVAKATADPQLIENLRQLMGAKRVITDPSQRSYYSTDLSAYPAVMAAAVIRPGSVEELARAVKLIAAAGYALMPRGGGMSYTRGYVPERHESVLVDMRGMNGIVEINTDDMYVTVEAGCTWKQLYEALQPRGVRTPYYGPLSGMYATVGGTLSQNSLFWGSGIYHTAADSCIGLEVVLANGEILHTGSGAHRHSNPFYRHFGPDLTGIFTADTGAFGIKTKITLRLIEAPAVTLNASFGFATIDAMLDVQIQLARKPMHLAQGRSTVVAINVGGAIVPVCICAWIIAANPAVILQAILGTAIVSLVVNRTARPIPGIGIATPMFIPPIVAAIVGIFLSGGVPHHADAIAYISGVLGTLIGADLMNLGRLGELGAPVASIGGAGTFDGIFLTGIVAVLLA